MMKFSRLCFVAVNLVLAGMVASCSPSKNGAESKKNELSELEAAKQTFYFSELGLNARLEKVESRNGSLESRFLIRFWDLSGTETEGPFVMPGFDVFLLPRKCAGCRGTFQAQLSQDSSLLDLGPVFEVNAQVKPGKNRMILQLKSGNQRTAEDSIVMVF